MKHLFFPFILILTLSLGCKKNDRFKVNTTEIGLEIRFEKFYETFHTIDTNSLESELAKLNNSYPRFFPLYCNQLIRIGSPGKPYFNSALKRFLSDSIYRQVADTVMFTFTDLAEDQAVITNGFKRFKYFFPDKTTPNIFYLISGFNESITTAPEMLGISLENYLGSNHTFYQWLGIYEYQRNNMYREKIPSDALWAWLITEFPDNNSGNLLSRIVYDGKILFILKQL